MFERLLKIQMHSGFSQTHKFGNIAIIANSVFPYILQFSSLFTPCNVSKCELKYQWI